MQTSLYNNAEVRICIEQAREVDDKVGSTYMYIIHVYEISDMPEKFMSTHTVITYIYNELRFKQNYVISIYTMLNPLCRCSFSISVTTLCVLHSSASILSGHFFLKNNSFLSLQKNLFN